MDEYHYILTCIDQFTRWYGIWPIKNISAFIVARIFVFDPWIIPFRVSDTIITDQELQFESGLFKQLLVTFGIQHKHSTPYHSQANGLVEWLLRSQKSALIAQNTIYLILYHYPLYYWLFVTWLGQPLIVQLHNCIIIWHISASERQASELLQTLSD